MVNPHRVAIVADRHFASELEALSRVMHVWVCASPSNKEAAQRIWASATGHDLESGVTTFDVRPTASPEEIVIDLLPTVDEHHGEYSHNPPWSILEIHGAPLTPTLKAALREFGVSEFEPWDGGFTCRRTGRGAA
jgi:hypothetical protein